MVPPGIPDFMSRVRFLAPSRQMLSGRAWSGCAPVTKVEVSVDGGLSWAEADLGEAPSAFAWRPWSYVWDATKPGEYELSVRATDGNWNREGVQNNAVQRVRVVVTESDDQVQTPADQKP
jgi:hypothetical protein